MLPYNISFLDCSLTLASACFALSREHERACTCEWSSKVEKIGIKVDMVMMRDGELCVAVLYSGIPVEAQPRFNSAFCRVLERVYPRAAGGVA